MFERKLYPEALSIGMPSEEFWEGEPRHLLSYIEAYRLRLEREEKFKSQFTDYQAWLTGAYCENAFSVVLSNAFGKKGGVKAKYPKEPISFSKNRVEKEADDEKKLLAVYAGFQSYANALNNRKFGGRR